MNKNSLHYLAFAFIIACVGHAHAQNLLTNGSFEIPGDAITTEGYVRFHGGTNAIVGWLTTLNGVEYADPSRSSSGTENTFFGVAADGSYNVDLAPYLDVGGGIEQAFPTTTGQVYVVSFFMGTLTRYGRDGTAFLKASAGGVTNSFGVTNATSFISWFPRSFAFLATETNTTLAFTSSDDPLLHFPLLDNVSVVPSGTNVTLAIGLYPGIRIDGRVGRTYVIEYLNAVSSTNWQELAYVTLATSSQFWFDTTLQNQTSRFYRAIEIP